MRFISAEFSPTYALYMLVYTHVFFARIRKRLLCVDCEYNQTLFTTLGKDISTQSPKQPPIHEYFIYAIGMLFCFKKPCLRRNYEVK